MQAAKMISGFIFISYSKRTTNRRGVAPRRVPLAVHVLPLHSSALILINFKLY
jgi:hypothetical protein